MDDINSAIVVQLFVVVFVLFFILPVFYFLYNMLSKRIDKKVDQKLNNIKEKIIIDVKEALGDIYRVNEGKKFDVNEEVFLISTISMGHEEALTIYKSLSKLS